MPGAFPLRVLVPVPGATLLGHLSIPAAARAVVVLARGGNADQPDQGHVARALGAAGLATLPVDLLTEAEAVVDARAGHLRFDVALLARRLIAVTDWVHAQSAMVRVPVGYFGMSTVAAAALVAAAARPEPVCAVVARSGRPDLAPYVLPHVQAPTLLIVGGADLPLIDLNRDARARLRVESGLEIVPDGSHEFEEPGAMDIVADLARRWFARHLLGAPHAR